MDEKDEAIIRALEWSANLSSRAVAERIGLPVSTVHRRIRKLEQEGVITGYRVLIDYEKTKRPIGACAFINLEEAALGKGHIPKSDVIARLKRIDGVELISDVQAANFDLVVRARFKSLKELSAFSEKLRSMEGIEELSTAVITEDILSP